MNTFLNGILVVFNPASGWRRIAEDDPGLVKLLLLHTVPYALIPAVSWYIGVTRAGWSVAGETMRMTSATALPLCILFFLAMVTGVLFLGYMVGWMAQSYGTEKNFARASALISYTASPFFVAGLLGLVPLLWLDIMLGTLVACYCVYLLYQGTSGMMNIPPERGFLYASAVFAVALVSFVGLLGATVVLWDFGAMPEYTY